MIDVKKYFLTASVAAILGIATAGIAYAADEPKATPDSSKASTESASKPAPDSGHIMMNHSIGDTKSMSMMKDKTVPIHHTGDAPAKADSSGCKDHVMMDHSVGDPKSMGMMKDKTVPIHNPCKPAANAKHSSAPVDHIMMNHSIGDSKSMNMMKDKKVPIHHSGDAATPAAESTSK